MTKFDIDGDSLVYSTYLGGSGGDSAIAIAVDATGNAHVTGSTSSSDFPIKHAFQRIYGGGPSDAFVSKLDAGGCALVYSSYLGGSDLDFGSRIALDADGAAYVTGPTHSVDFPTTENAFQNELKSARGNMFVTKIRAK